MALQVRNGVTTTAHSQTIADGILRCRVALVDQYGQVFKYKTFKFTNDGCIRVGAGQYRVTVKPTLFEGDLAVRGKVLSYGNHDYEFVPNA